MSKIHTIKTYKTKKRLYKLVTLELVKMYTENIIRYYTNKTNNKHLTFNHRKKDKAVIIENIFSNYYKEKYNLEIKDKFFSEKINNLKSLLFLTGLYHLIEEIEYDKYIFEEAYHLRGIGKIFIVHCDTRSPYFKSKYKEQLCGDKVSPLITHIYYRNIKPHFKFKIDVEKSYYFNHNYVAKRVYDKFDFVGLLMENNFHTSQVKFGGIKVTIGESK